MPLATNANVDIVRILKDISSTSVVSMLTIQFPDPHFKSKHKKRRVVKDDFVESVGQCLSSGTKVFLQSDVIEVIEDMVAVFGSSPLFKPSEGYSSTRLLENKSPVNVQTEREVATLARGLPVYRMMFKRV